MKICSFYVGEVPVGFLPKLHIFFKASRATTKMMGTKFALWYQILCSVVL